MSEELRRCGEIIRNIALALDDTTMCMNTHSQDQCNEALYDFYKRVGTILYIPTELAASPKEKKE